jgi:hypothetical protein
MGILIFAAILAVPISLLALMLRLRESKHPEGGYGGRYDAPGRMSVMTYAEASAMVDNRTHSFAENATTPFQETDVTNPDAP